MNQNQNRWPTDGVLTMNANRRNKIMPQIISSGRAIQAAALLLALALILFSEMQGQAQANPLATAPSRGGRPAKRDDAPEPYNQQQQHKAGAGYNNIENLISELLDDVGNRLKKSKLHPIRQIKQTLRFGRSDPYMAPSSSGNDYETLANSLERQQQDETLEPLDRN